MSEVGRTESGEDLLEPGDPRYRRMLGAVFLAGFAVFLVMYDTQGLLPQIGGDLGAGEALAGWTVAATTLGMAGGMIPLSRFGLRWGLFTRMVVFVLLAGAVGVGVGAMPSIGSLIAARLAQGLLVAVVPASALALIAERATPRAITHATGIYLAGNTVGGLASRLGPGLLAEVTTWRWALAAMGTLCLVCGLVVILLLRPSGTTVPAVLPGRGGLSTAIRDSLATAGVPAACLAGAALMASFNSAYTVIGFRLQSPPLGLGPGPANLVFLLYLLGTFASPRAGGLAARFGAAPVLITSALAVAAGYLIAGSASLVPVVIGLGLMTGMFFVGHTVASATVGRLSPARSRSTAAALYLTAYYVGATGGSALGTWGFELWGWRAPALFSLGYTVIAVLAGLRIALRLRTPSRSPRSTR